MHATLKTGVVLMLSLLMSATLQLDTGDVPLYSRYDYHYANEPIFYHNDVIWTPEALSGSVQCADACSRAGPSMCTAFRTRDSDNGCEMYGGWLNDSSGVWAGAERGLQVNRVVTVWWCQSSKCTFRTRIKADFNTAKRICSSSYGGQFATTQTGTRIQTARSHILEAFGGVFDIWLRVGTRASDGTGGLEFYWEKTGQKVSDSTWANGPQKPSSGKVQEECVYLSAVEARLAVAPCSDRKGFICINI